MEWLIFQVLMQKIGLKMGKKNLASQSRSYNNWALTIKKTSKNALIFLNKINNKLKRSSIMSIDFFF